MDSLDPVQRAGAQLVEVLTVRGGLDRHAARRRAVELFDMVGLNARVLEQYPHEFSGGMKQRAVIAMALALNPSLLIADEPVTALDVVVQHQVLEVFKRLEDELRLTVMLINARHLGCRVSVQWGRRHVCRDGSWSRLQRLTFFGETAPPLYLGAAERLPQSGAAQGRSLSRSRGTHPIWSRRPKGAGSPTAARLHWTHAARPSRHSSRLGVSTRAPVCAPASSVRCAPSAADPATWRDTELLVSSTPQKTGRRPVSTQMPPSP